MPSVQVNGIELAYETFGSGEPLVLIMGIGCQMVMWDEQFCRDLAACGFEVTRFDNRDVGQSSNLRHLPAHGPEEVLKRRLTGRPVGAAYSLYDMAEDTSALIEALGHRSAHVVGMSLGGMVAQCLAIKHPERVRSLTLIMTTPGEIWANAPTVRGLSAILKRPARTRDAVIRHQVKSFKQIGGTRHNSPPSLVEKWAGQQFDRGLNPRGFARQFAAVVSAPGRLSRLRKLRVPTQVIHGGADPLVRPLGGRLLASAIPGARLDVIKGMGHDIGPSIWPFLIDRIYDNSRRNRESLPKRGNLANMFKAQTSV